MNNDNFDNSICATAVAAENSDLRKSLVRANILLDDGTPLSCEFMWGVTFRPRYFTLKYSKKRGRPYVITRGSKKESVCSCKNWDDLQSQIEKCSELAWIMKYTNISKKIFEFARNNPYFFVPITVEINKYIKDYGNYVNEGLNHEIGEEDLK